MKVLMDEASLEDLILQTIDLVNKKGRKCSYGTLVVEAYKLFPNIFALSEYPQYPDTVKFDRPLRKLREKGYIKGGIKTYFKVSKLGESMLQQLSKKSTNKKTITRSPALVMLKEIEKSKDFRNFLEKGTEFTPSNMRIRETTKFTLESPNKEIVSFLKYLLTFANTLKNNQLEDYINLYINYLK